MYPLAGYRAGTQSALYIVRIYAVDISIVSPRRINEATSMSGQVSLPGVPFILPKVNQHSMIFCTMMQQA